MLLGSRQIYTYIYIHRLQIYLHTNVQANIQHGAQLAHQHRSMLNREISRTEKSSPNPVIPKPNQNCTNTHPIYLLTNRFKFVAKSIGIA